MYFGHVCTAIGRLRVRSTLRNFDAIRCAHGLQSLTFASNSRSHISLIVHPAPRMTFVGKGGLYHKSSDGTLLIDEGSDAEKSEHAYVRDTAYNGVGTHTTLGRCTPACAASEIDQAHGQYKSNEPSGPVNVMVHKGTQLTCRSMCGTYGRRVQET